MIDRTQCPTCEAPGLREFHEQLSVPAKSCLLPADPQASRDFTRRAALAVLPRVRIHHQHALRPGLAEYSSRYEETQSFSGRFMTFARDLAKRWVDRHDLHGKSVLEIGCGRGEFLEFMVEAGAGQGTGIDPGVNPDRTNSATANRITDFYSEAATRSCRMISTYRRRSNP